MAVLLFDIDGTLLSVRRGFTLDLILKLMDRLSLDTSSLDEISFAGRTDYAIFTDLLGEDHYTEERFLAFKNGYIDGVHDQLRAEDINVLPFAPETLAWFRDAGHSLGILTGNFREIAAHKLALAGLDGYFSFGAFGCNHYDRNNLAAEALADFRECYRRAADPQECIVVGDTPLDIACARALGGACVSVATGRYSARELRIHQPDMLIQDLSDPEDWSILAGFYGDSLLFKEK